MIGTQTFQWTRYSSNGGRRVPSTKLPLENADLMTLFEAARWAPSSYNAQPWRFVYALRETASWTRFLDLLNPFNRSWAENAAAIIFIISDSLIQPTADVEPMPSHSHSFDAGAAWALLALPGHPTWATHPLHGGRGLRRAH